MDVGKKSAVGWWAGAALLLLVLPLQGITLRSALGLSALHVGVLAASGWALGRILGWPRPVRWSERITMGFLQGWITLPAYLMADWVAHGRCSPLWILTGLLVVAFRRRPAAPVDFTIPAWVFALALAYTAWSVGLPLRHFHDASIVRELYSDAFQRFGMAYALAGGTPPSNPFVFDLPTRYYWFSFLPLGLEQRGTGASMFDLWRVAQTWFAFFLLPGLWWMTRRQTTDRVAAWALLFGFVFSSYEWLLASTLRDALPLAAAGQGWEALTALIRRDPDHVIGLVNAYSDQIFVEDFLYIPHNALALALCMLGAWLMTEGRPRAALFTWSLLAGFNTFFILPVTAAAALWMMTRVRVRDGIAPAVLYVSSVLAWLACCGVVPISPLPLLAVGALAALVPVPVTHPAPPVRWAGWAAGGALVVLVLLLAVAPVPRMSLLVINYGPAFLLAVGGGLLAVRGRLPATWTPLVFFLCVYTLAQQGISLLLEVQFHPALPAAVRAVSTELGQQVDYFNFYHKTAKGVRWAWCVLGAMFLVQFQPRWSRPRVLVAGLLLLPAVGTNLIRPLTYAHDERPVETEAARMLRSAGLGHRARVLAEDYRFTAIGQLSGASLYFVSSWSGQPPGHTHAVGTWAFQYVPPAHHGEVLERESQLQRIIGPPFDPVRLEEVVRAHRIDFVLLREPRELGAYARPWLVSPGAVLYDCRSP